MLFKLIMNLIVDIGNSSTKMALFDGREKISSFRTKHFTCGSIGKLLSPYKIDKAIISTVRDLPEFIYDLLTVNIPYTHLLSYKSKLPFKIRYETPETLGPDRIAAVAGAWSVYQGEEVLIIDAGSAVTYDYLIGNTWPGGNISPGLSMRFRALHKFTGKLPLVTTTEKYSSPGKNTFEAISAGVIDGLIFEIDENIRRFKEKHNDAKVILAGGDAGYLKERINYQVSFMPDLVIEGLNHILESCVEEVA